MYIRIAAIGESFDWANMCTYVGNGRCFFIKFASLVIKRPCHLHVIAGCVWRFVCHYMLPARWEVPVATGTSLLSLLYGELDGLRNRKPMPLGVVQNGRRVPNRVGVTVRADLAASWERIMRVLFVRFHPLGMRPAVRPSQLLQSPP